MGKDLKGKELGQGLSQRKDGRYSARITANGKRVEKYFKKISEAKRWFNDALYEKEHGLFAPDKYTVDEWFWKWVDMYKKDVVSDSTYKNYKSVYVHHVKDKIGFMKLKDVRQSDCQNVLNTAYESGLAYGTMNLIRITLHALFDGTVNDEVLLKNPVTQKVKCCQREVEERRVLTSLEQSEFLKYSQNSMYNNAYALVLCTGLRSGEIGGLKWEDVDFEKKMLHVRRTLLYDKSKGGFYFGSPKSRKSKRDVPLTDEAIIILKNQKLFQFKLRGKSSNWNMDPEYDGLAFTSMNGQPTGHLTYIHNIIRIVTNINSDRRTISKLENVPFEEFEPMTMHTLRHTFATRSIESGVKPNVLQKILGHSSITVTMDAYVHTLDEEKVKEMRKIKIDLPKKQWRKNGVKQKCKA